MLSALPKSIRVGAYDVSIEVSEDLQVDGKEAWGAYYASEKKIRIHKAQPSSTFALDSFIHELNHAIYDIWCMAKGDSEERTVAVFSTAWTQLLRDNPKILRWMLTVAR
jgi:hypothetical protein